MNFFQLHKIIYRHKTWILLLVVLIVSGVLHGFNMLNYPYYESDEGTYTSQAWSILTQGSLSPYTYWYDHPPMGWVLIAGWFYIIPKGIFAFGTSIDTARVLMLVIHIISTALVFFITKRITRSDTMSFLVTALYAVTPLGLYFHRRVLLDNMLTMWLLASVAILLRKNLTLKEFIASGFFYALAFLTKISVVMFGPAMLFLVIFLPTKISRIFRTATWLTVSILTVSVYIIFALLKNELVTLDGSAEKVSLVESLRFQMSRGSDLYFFESGSDFMLALQDWWNRDPWFIILIVLSLLMGVIFSVWRGAVFIRFFTLGALFYVFFLIRGGIVINFYVVPLLPFAAILFGLVAEQLADVLFEYTKRLTRSFNSKHFSRIIKDRFTLFFLVLVMAIFILLSIRSIDAQFFVKDETKNQISALNWIKRTLPVQSDIVIDSVMYVELHDPRYLNTKVFENAEWFFKVSRDPQIRFEKYNNSWKTLDYVAITHEMLKQIDKFEKSDLVREAFDNSLPIAKWFEGSSSFIDEQKLITTNGDWSMVYQINGTTKAQLVDSWNSYKESFIVSYGQTVDRTSENVTTSEGQSYAMLRAAWMNDKETFNGSWLWTQHHLQHRLDDNLISWKWMNNRLIDSANATDADQDIALALLFGSKIFAESSYVEDAKKIIIDLWENSVVEAGGKYYVISANRPQSQVHGGLLFNPSYMSPAHYRIFAEVDLEHDWNKVADDVYAILDDISSQNSTNLPANWYILNEQNGQLTSAGAHISGADLYSYDAFRILWRVWLDYSWFANEEAEYYLQSVGRFVDSQTTGLNKIATIYNPRTGAAISREDSIAIQSGYVLALASLDDDEKAISYYDEFVASRYNEEGHYWGDARVYYDQNWVWFVSAVFNNDIYNLWATF